MSLVNFNNIKEFDLNKIVLILVPINGKNEYIRRISTPSGLTLWQVYETDILYKDNIPVTLTYDMNPNTSSMFYQSNENLMYLIPVGNINRYDNILKSFTNTAYAHTPIHINWSTTNSFEILLKIKTGNNTTIRQELFSMQKTESIELEIINKKLHWEKANIYGRTTLLPNTIYFVKFVKTNTNVKVYLSIDGKKYQLEIDSTKTFTVNNEYLHLGIDKVHGGSNGIEPFLGQIYLNQSYIYYNNIKYNLRITDDELFLIRDGAIQVDNQVISKFTNTAYAHTPIHINWSTTNETTIGLKIRTGNNVTSRQELFGMQTTDNFELEILNGKIHWELTGTSGIIINANTDYFIEFKKVKTRYTITVYKYNNNTLVKHGTITASSSRSCSNQYLYLGIDKQNSGIEPFDGTIDCKESYIIYNNKKYKFRI